jgi:hypothetical protein
VRSSPPTQFSPTPVSLYPHCGHFQQKSVMLGSCCYTVREALSWLRRSVASLSPRRPGFDPRPVCVICGRRSGTGSGFLPNTFCFPLFRFFPPILRPHKNNMCYVLTILFVMHVLWHLYTGRFFLGPDTTTYSLSLTPQQQWPWVGVHAFKCSAVSVMLLLSICTEGVESSLRPDLLHYLACVRTGT